MKRIFVCSPFRGDVARNLEIAHAACRVVLDHGHAPFAPHVLYPCILDDADPEERAAGIRAGLAWLAASDELWVFGTPTSGMQQEIAEAERLGIAVKRLP